MSGYILKPGQIRSTPSTTHNLTIQAPRSPSLEVIRFRGAPAKLIPCEPAVVPIALFNSADELPSDVSQHEAGPGFVQFRARQFSYRMQASAEVVRRRLTSKIRRLISTLLLAVFVSRIVAAVTLPSAAAGMGYYLSR